VIVEYDQKKTNKKTPMFFYIVMHCRLMKDIEVSEEHSPTETSIDLMFPRRWQQTKFLLYYVALY